MSKRIDGYKPLACEDPTTRSAAYLMYYGRLVIQGTVNGRLPLMPRELLILSSWAYAATIESLPDKSHVQRVARLALQAAEAMWGGTRVPVPKAEALNFGFTDRQLEQSVLESYELGPRASEGLAQTFLGQLDQISEGLLLRKPMVF